MLISLQLELRDWFEDQELYVTERVELRNPRWVGLDRWVNGKNQETMFLMLFQVDFWILFGGAGEFGIVVETGNWMVMMW